MERVVRLHMAENIYIHRDAIELIRANLGPAASNEVIGRAAGDIADTLITVEHALCLGDTGQLRRALRHLRSVGEQLGLLQLARVADDALAMAERGNAVALHAIVGRLMRLGDASLDAVIRSAGMDG
ncbi:MAG: hypothetical protein KDK00_08640 [Rhodobacteraceae bacterium]|nr:hypothetical protein [Paracoccaceae bacterium]